MATIRFRRGETDPIASIQPTGLTMGEPVFNRKLNKFWVGGSGPAGFTAIWMGAEIENTIDWSTPSQYKLATQYAIDQRVKQIIGASAGVQSIAGLSGTIALVFGTGISGSTSAGTITLQNTGVTGLGLSGDWRTRGVTNFGGAATGGVTLASEVWQGSANPVLNTITTWGITAGTVLTGKTPMEILEIMLYQYLTPNYTSFTMNFDGAGDATTATVIFAFGMTADPDSSTPSVTVSNGTNISTGVSGSISVSKSSGADIRGDAGPFAVNPPTSSGNVTPAINPTVKYKGVSFGTNSSGNCEVSFTLLARSTQASSGFDVDSNAKTYSWYPRIYFGRSTDSGLTYPPDSWKKFNILTSHTQSSSSTKGSTTGFLMQYGLPFTFNMPAGASDEYLYWWIDSYYNVSSIKSGGVAFSVFPSGTAGELISGLTIDDGFTTRTFRRYRSNVTQGGAFEIDLA